MKLKSNKWDPYMFIAMVKLGFTDRYIAKVFGLTIGQIRYRIRSLNSLSKSADS